ncbi:glycerophosphodiester phosphodiesterase family protein [Nocardioides sp. zg-1228]|uniref:glycerophosphodiester phosphodiesterase family protein n=1 Tax=Nocardioides sp. zg-1228 TaxID=2763008 RepID=UPI0016429EBD|nr:glycerophosphodiester phosphodiesterase family protein [Nocardioides sp. zg-1228]MBC2934618.1 glycerophosphodiester phosphodiesterase [Nocardioides sp. zg-1228]QSF59365.1 glycerophosphodiester phosphodiesterase [Nocardioides sp. zg-1228]
MPSPHPRVPAYLDAPRPLAFAHRGGAYHPEIEGLENTLTAFAHAVELGYTYLETDVHVTSDGVLLAFHDTVLDRVTDRTGSIADSTYAEVQRAAVGGSEPVPTLAELFDAFPATRFNLDLKADGAVEALARFVEERAAWDRVLVGSFSRRRLERFRRRTRGRVATSAHPLEVVAFVLSPSARLARWLTRGRPVALQVPHHRGRVLVVSRGLVRRAHAAGLQVHVWTIDDPIEMNALLDRGVDGIMTDRTDILRDVLRARGQWNGHVEDEE